MGDVQIINSKSEDELRRIAREECERLLKEHGLITDMDRIIKSTKAAKA